MPLKHLPPTNDAKEFAARGYSALLRGDQDHAIRYLSQAITLGLKDRDTYLKRADAYEQKGKLREAIADYSKILRLNPTDTVIYCLRGSAFARRGEDNLAIRDFTRTIQLQPNAPQGFRKRGEVYLHQGKWERALADFNRVLQLDPKDHQTLVVRGNLYHDLRDTTHALMDLNRAIELDPTKGKAYLDRAVVWFLKKNYAEAWIDLRSSRERGVVPNPRFIKDLERASSNLDRSINLNFATSLFALLAVPERYDGKLVVVHGYLDYYQGTCHLYTEETSSQHGLLENALYINIESYEKQVTALRQKYCIVHGIFSRTCPRPWGNGVGGIVKIERLFPADYTRN